MGEIAEMMLEGVLCEGCGEYMGDGDGFPTRCAACRRDEKSTVTLPTKAECPICKKRVKAIGLDDHIRAVHAAEAG